MFELETPELEGDGAPRNAIKSTLLRIELDQMHGAGHLIGRFEISVTNGAGPLLLKPSLPREISMILNFAEATRSDDHRMQLAAYLEQRRIQQELATLPKPAMVYCGTNQFDADGSFRPAIEPRAVHVLDRGEIAKPLRPAKATTLSCVEGVEPNTERFNSPSDAQRRATLAEWMASPENGLVSRSIANRVWHYHFGQPLVDTPNEFGNAGSSPTHPQLLDWLAVTLQESDASLKALHRLIVTSATYQQSAAHRDDAARIDAGNRMLWRMNRSRLDAESFRDSLLKVSGTLDNRMGRPSDRLHA